LAASGSGAEALGGDCASPALLECLHKLAARTGVLLSESDGFAAAIGDWRLGLEVSVINTLAHRLTRLLQMRDPLRDNVHLGVPSVAGRTLIGILSGGSQRIGRRFLAGSQKPRGA